MSLGISFKYFLNVDMNKKYLIFLIALCGSI